MQLLRRFMSWGNGPPPTGTMSIQGAHCPGRGPVTPDCQLFYSKLDLPNNVTNNDCLDRFNTMARHYIKKTTKASYGTKKLQEALEEIAKNKPIKSVSKQFGIPARTLRRHDSFFCYCLYYFPLHSQKPS